MSVGMTEDFDVEVEFHYSVLLQESQLEQDEEGRWRIKAEDKEQAYEMLVEGISDDSGLDVGSGGEWYPRYEVLCQQEFMAGQICALERGHEGSHA